MKALQQGFSRQQGETARLAAAGKSPGRHAGERVQEAQIVSVGVAAPGDAQAEGAHAFFRHRAEFLLAAHLPRQPQLAGPEAGCPLYVVGQRVITVPAGFRRELLSECR